MGHGASKHVKLEEQLAIFLYACVTGLPVRHLVSDFRDQIRQSLSIFNIFSSQIVSLIFE